MMARSAWAGNNGAVDLPATPFATGRDADVFALDDQWVLRRYRRGRPVEWEATVMRYVADHGYPVPAVRSAIGGDLVLERLHGPTMLRAVAEGTVTIEDCARDLAALHRQLHRLPVPDQDGLTLRTLRSEPPSERHPDRLLHLDLHPANVMLTDRGPVVIDWANTRIGPAGVDESVTAVILAIVALSDFNPTDTPVPDVGAMARALLAGFCTRAEDPVTHLGLAVAHRRSDGNVTPQEDELLNHVEELITAQVG